MTNYVDALTQAWGLLTIITAFSFKPIRNRYYELFYWSHVGLLLLFFAACIVHHRVRGESRNIGQAVL